MWTLCDHSLRLDMHNRLTQLRMATQKNTLLWWDWTTCSITSLRWLVMLMGPGGVLRIKTLDAENPLLHTELEVKVVEHSSSTK